MNPRKQSEEVVQQHIMHALRSLGYAVLQTSEHRRSQSCRQCGHLQHLGGGRGCSKGVPDVLCRHPQWPEAVWLGIEAKSTTGRLSDDQKNVQRIGGLVVARSVDEAITAAQEMNAQLAEAL